MESVFRYVLSGEGFPQLISYQFPGPVFLQTGFSAMAMCLTEKLGDKARKLPSCKLVEVLICADLGSVWGKMAF